MSPSLFCMAQPKLEVLISVLETIFTEPGQIGAVSFRSLIIQRKGLEPIRGRMTVTRQLTELKNVEVASRKTQPNG